LPVQNYIMPFAALRARRTHLTCQYLPIHFFSVPGFSHKAHCSEYLPCEISDSELGFCSSVSFCSCFLPSKFPKNPICTTISRTFHKLLQELRNPNSSAQGSQESTSQKGLRKYQKANKSKQARELRLG